MQFLSLDRIPFKEKASDPSSQLLHTSGAGDSSHSREVGEEGDKELLSYISYITFFL